MITDGSRIEYTGLRTETLEPGDQGSVLVASGHSAHVQWRTGSLAGQVTLEEIDDLHPLGSRQGAVEADLDDSLEVSGIGTVTARQIYDEGGSSALLNAMADSGKLSSFQDIAEEALTLVASRLRSSDSFTAVSSHLDDDEREELLRTASAALIRDAFTPS
jgi:hypothetical protein